MIVILMGPSGVGKSTIGRALADDLRWRFLDADDLHSPASVAQMRRGLPLSDSDRQPWLLRVHESLREAVRSGEHVVLACSALRQAYRDRIGAGLPDIHWVYLVAPPAVLARRLAHRAGHFAGPEILPNQLAVLEPPADALVVGADQPVHDAVATIRAALRP